MARAVLVAAAIACMLFQTGCSSFGRESTQINLVSGSQFREVHEGEIVGKLTGGAVKQYIITDKALKALFGLDVTESE